MSRGPDHRTLDTGTVDADNPWPGLAAFREADERFFQGRETVVGELTRMVLRARLTVLHGVSGLGKTSLLRAGLFPRLRREHVLPIYVRLSHAADSAGLVEQVRQAIARAAEAAGIEAPDATPGETLWEYFHRKDTHFWDARNRIITPLLVFDQFEELFTIGRATAWHRARTGAFIAELGDLVEGRPAADVRARLEQAPEEALRFSLAEQPCKLLLSLREDFLPDLAELRSHIPAITDTMFRLQPMTAAEALRVVEVGGGGLVEHDVAEQIVWFVASERAGSAMNGEAAVEPALLSVFCRELNNKRRAQGRAQITADLLEGNRTTIISDFYQRTISEGGLNPAVRVFVEERLLTESGFRDNVAEEHALRTAGVSAADIELLIARRLLRREDVGRGRSRLELTHDVLAQAVKASRDERRVRERQQRELAERLAAEERRRHEAEAAAAREQQRREFEAAQALAAKEREAAELAQALARQEQRAREAAERLARTRERQVASLAVLILATVLMASYAWREAQRASDAEALANSALSAAYVDRVARGEAWPLAYLARAIRYDPDAVAPGALILGLLSRQVLPLAEMPHQEGVERAAFNATATRVLTLSDGGTARLWDAHTGQVVGGVLGAESPVTVAVFSPDGARVLTASEAGVAQVWDAMAGAPLGEPLRHDGAVNAASFNRHGTRVVTASDDQAIRVWDLESGEHRAIHTNQGPLAHAAFDRTGTHVLSISEQGAPALWDVASGLPAARLESAEDGTTTVTSATFSPDGSRIVAVLTNGTAHVIGTRTGRRTGRVLSDAGPIVSAAFDPAGERVVTTSLQDGSGGGSVARVWDARTGARLHHELNHSDWISTVEFSPDGALIVTGSHDRSARIWDAATGEPVGAPLRHSRRIVRAGFSPDGTRVLTASEDGTAQLWEVPTGRESGSPLRHDGPLVSAAFSSDGALVLTASQDRTARVWDARTGVVVETRLRHGDGFRIELAAFSHDGAHVATAGSLDPNLPASERERRGEEEHVALIWNVATAERVGTPLKHAALLKSLEFSPRGAPRVVTASADHTARLWNAHTGEPVGAVLQHDGPVFSATFSPDGSRVLTASEDGTARVWDAATGEALGAPLRHDGPVLSARFGPDGTTVITAAAGRARLWNATTGEAVGDLVGHDDVVSAAFSPDGARLLTYSSAYSMIWDSTTRTPRNLRLHHEGAATAPVFSGDGVDVVTMSTAGTWVWDVRGEPVLRGQLRHDAAVLSAAFSADGRLVTAGEDGTARLWDVRTRDEVGLPLRHGSPLRSVRFSKDSSRVLTLAADGIARIWDVPAGRPDDTDLLATLAEAIGGREVGPDGTVQRRPDQVSELAALRARARSTPAEGHSADGFAHWLFADPATRTISPLSHITVPEWIARLLAEGEAGRREATRLFPGHQTFVTSGDRFADQARREPVQ